MGQQCSAQGVDQMEADFAAIQRNVVTLKTVPQKLDELEKKIKGIQVTAQNVYLLINIPLAPIVSGQCDYHHG